MAVNTVRTSNRRLHNTPICGKSHLSGLFSTHPYPPGYQRRQRPPKPKIDPYRDRIAEILEADKLVHKKQRHTAKRTVDGKTSTECRYSISSHSGRQSQKLAALIHNQWRAENELHWTLDVSFDEDQCRVRIQNAAENIARIQQISLILLKKETTCKLGIKSKRAKAGYDRDYLLTLLGFRANHDTKSP